MTDQVYLPKSAQYQSGENVEEGNLYKVICILQYKLQGIVTDNQLT